jgi:acyl-CoA synthetase (AMP-forming)/AMP-acid ligase II
MVTTPFHIVSMLEVLAEEPFDLSSMRMMIAGGAPVRPDLILRAQDAGMVVVRSYGMSEHPTVLIGDPDDPLEVRANRDGKVTPNNRLRLVDDEGRPVPVGGRGEVQVQGPEQFIGYTNVPLAETFTEDGWFPTGDIGLLDAEGYVTLVDRKKNIIIRGGENLSATEIEDVVGTHPAVAEVGVIGVPDDRYGEQACAVVVLREGATLTLEDLGRHFAAAGVARQKVPEHLRFVTSLPRSGTGKIRKAELQRQLSQA